MNRRFLIVSIGVVVVGLGMGVGAGLLQARAGSNEAKSTPNASVQQSQVTRNAGGQGQSGQGLGGNNQGARQQGGGSGTIADLGAGGFNLVSQNGQISVVISVTTNITRTDSIKVSDLKVGDQVIATGSQQSDGTLTATSIQAGIEDSQRGFGGGFPSGAGQFGPGGQSNPAGQPGQGRGQDQGNDSDAQPQRTPREGNQFSMVNGAISALGEDFITVKGQSGSLTRVTVSSEAIVRKTVEGVLSDLKNGQTAFVSGERNDAGAIVATAVQLVPAALTMPRP